MASRISTLDREISIAASNLKPKAEEVLPQCLRLMLNVGMTLSPAIDQAMMIDAYRYAISGLPAAALQKATECLIKGDIERTARWCIPIPPELAAIARDEATSMYNDLRRMQETRDTLKDIAARAQPKDEASKTRVRALIAATKTRSDVGVDSRPWGCRLCR
ncbi:hypothetical protein BMJ23_07370 [Sinorhizobium medicae]|nr:hypothetical protein BMJ23_07370 [Sinorhizobium medicae]